MECVIGYFIENVEMKMNADSPLFAGTETRTKESPDKLNSSLSRMQKTLTEAKETPDRSFIPMRHLN